MLRRVSKTLYESIRKGELESSADLRTLRRFFSLASAIEFLEIFECSLRKLDTFLDARMSSVPYSAWYLGGQDMLLMVAQATGSLSIFFWRALSYCSQRVLNIYRRGSAACLLA